MRTAGNLYALLLASKFITEIGYKEHAKKTRIGENYLINGGNLAGNDDN